MLLAVGVPRLNPHACHVRGEVGATPPVRSDDGAEELVGTAGWPAEAADRLMAALTPHGGFPIAP
ncbi:hypothetical protein GA0070624_4932 [Micromonospora rhizosphaerae]|uniref:Uncharacterized protein n=1 Tax=Micromonospora rhizosphaerae TaxID=568872 RepID=A0A1C6SYK1_9ACTN|nr:hypothetical protein GA0070624_4932 [Micromonospora rhizosphaerae]